jgi:hypothetical protein
MVGPGFEDWWSSRRFWEGAVFAPVGALPLRLAPSPGAVWGLVLDDRPSAVAIRPLPAPPGRAEEYAEYNATLARNFAGKVRAFAREFVGGGGSGPWVRFIARADGAPIAAQHDWDDASTLAFNLCRNIHLSSNGVRGGDTQPRLITDTNTPGVRNPIFCPSGAAYSEDSSVLINRFADRVIATGGGGLRQCPWCNAADMDIVVDILSARNWGRSASPDTDFTPSGPIPLVAGCSVGAGIAAWDRAASERARR